MLGVLRRQHTSPLVDRKIGILLMYWSNATMIQLFINLMISLIT
jgi:hypothetical protein